jgi:hypothetical protein
VKRAVLLSSLFLAACGFGDDRTGALDPDPDAGESIDAPPSPIDAPPTDAPIAACTLVPQSGCPAGRACDLTGTGGETTCREITAQGMADDTCAGASQCAAGYTCVDTEDEGSCLELCASDGDCAPANGSRCVIELEDAGGQPIPGGTYCTQACSPQTASGCPAAWNCLVLDDAGGDATRCIPAGADTQDVPCNSVLECAAGYTCVNHDNTRTCQRNCRVGVAGTCNAFPGTACGGFASPHVIAGVEWGVCL